VPRQNPSINLPDVRPLLAQKAKLLSPKADHGSAVNLQAGSGESPTSNNFMHLELTEMPFATLEWILIK